MVVDLGRDAESPEWFSLAAFASTGEALARHGKGDMVAVSGKVTKSAWTGKDGTERAGFSVLADSIASARTVRPRKAQAKREDAEAVPFDDARSMTHSRSEPVGMSGVSSQGGSTHGRASTKAR